MYIYYVNATGGAFVTFSQIYIYMYIYIKIVIKVCLIT